MEGLHLGAFYIFNSNVTRIKGRLPEPLRAECAAYIRTQLAPTARKMVDVGDQDRGTAWAQDMCTYLPLSSHTQLRTHGDDVHTRP